MAPQLQQLIAQYQVNLLSLASMALRKRKILTLEVSVINKIEKGQSCLSVGWLEKWQKHHNVRMVVLTGEAADVDPTVVSDWSERLKTLL